ncbi:MAG: transposase [Pseudomonadota bacterium]
MARKWYSDENVLRLLREIELSLAVGLDVVRACQKAGVPDTTDSNWRQKSDGVSKSQLAEKKALEKENARLDTAATISAA